MGLYLIHKVRSCIFLFHLSPRNFICHFVTSLLLSPSFSAGPHNWPLFYSQNNSASPAEGVIAKKKKKLLLIIHPWWPSAQQTQARSRRGHFLLGSIQISLVEHLPPPETSPGVRALALHIPEALTACPELDLPLSPALCPDLGPSDSPGCCCMESS